MYYGSKTFQSSAGEFCGPTTSNKFFDRVRTFERLVSPTCGVTHHVVIWVERRTISALGFRRLVSQLVKEVLNNLRHAFVVVQPTFLRQINSLRAKKEDATPG